MKNKELNPQAIELNNILQKDNPIILDLLSTKGKAIFFPKKGILAQAKEAKGKAINATIGAAIEDDGTPMRLQSISKNIELEPKEVFPYAPSYGKPELRKVWKELILKKNPSIKSNITLPITTCALTHGLSMLGYLFLDEDETLIMPDKYWGNYNLVFKNAYNTNINTFNTFNKSGLDLESLKNKLKETEGNKKLLLNFPNNPTGYTPNTEEVEEIKKILLEEAENDNKLLVICDDAYFGLVYEENTYKESIFSELCNLHENILAVKIDGATKEDYAWGLRVGFITYGTKNLSKESATALESKTAGAIRGNISNAPHISQSLILTSITSETYQEEKQEKYEIMKSRYLAVKEYFNNPFNQDYKKYFKALPYNSGYFMCIELNEKLNAEAVRELLLSKYDTGVIAINNMLRIAFSSVGAEKIPTLFENIYSACKEI